MKSVITTLVSISLLAGLPVAAEKTRTAYDISLAKEREIGLALSAAPEHLQAEAGVYVLGKKGYSQVRESRNGFNCLVERAGKGTLAPLCYDAEGSETLMPAQFRKAELILSGSAFEEASKIVESEFKSGKLTAPRRPGIAYMLSKEFGEHNAETGEFKCLYPPHVMFYAPYLKNSDFGFKKDQIGSTGHPWILMEGTPGAFIIVVPQSE